MHENLGLDTKTTFSLHLEQKSWHIYQNNVHEIGGHLGFF